MMDNEKNGRHNQRTGGTRRKTRGLPNLAKQTHHNSDGASVERDRHRPESVSTPINSLARLFPLTQGYRREKTLPLFPRALDR